MSKKILIISQNTVIGVVGGAIKSFCLLINALSKLNYKVIAACYSPQKGKPYIELEKSVKFVNLYYLNTYDFKPKKYKLPLIERILSKIYNEKALELGAHQYSMKVEYLIEKEKPDLVIFFFPHILFLSTFRKNFDIPKVLLFRSRPDVYYELFAKKQKNKGLIKLASKKADASVVLLKSYEKLAGKYLNCKAETIPNYVEIPEQQADLSVKKKILIYLSRMGQFKGHGFLIRSFAKIADKYPDWQIHIYGQIQMPKYQKYLDSLIEFHKLQEQIKILSVTSNPVEKFLQADICVFPSYFEGFPNGLAEAMACGLPCIGLKTCSGVNELIKNNENGFLCRKNEKDFAEKMALLMDNKELRIKFGNNARESMKKYSYENFITSWKNFIEKVIQDSGEKYTK